MDWTEAADRLALAAGDEQAWYAGLAAELTRGADVRVALDIGCGGAGMTAALARTLPDTALVVAADHSPAVLDKARDLLAGAAGIRARVEFAVVDLDRGVDGLPDADLVWASASTHHAGDQQRAVDALAS